MKNLFDAAVADEVKGRIGHMRSDSQRQWGKMTPAQALAHLSMSMEAAVGDDRPSRMFIGRLIGPLVKRTVVKDEAPMRRNAPTDKRLVVADDRDLEAERRRLIGLVDRFRAGGPTACTTHPHVFFGSMTPNEWAVLMYKHLDHHLRQFGA